jgi:mycobactin lysine-N-oxygenase
MCERDLIVVGAGAKAAAIAAKVHALNTVGLGPLTMTAIEASQPGASWTGRHGMTTGEEPLAISPVKDVGFPYESSRAFGEAGQEVDCVTSELSWQRYLIGKGRYARWVNGGAPAIEHREYGEYLAWVLARASNGAEVLRGRVTEVSLTDSEERWRVTVAGADGEAQLECRALVLTGPGSHRELPHDPEAEARLFHCDSRRSELGRIPAERESRVAVIGGGESALSCLMFLRAFRPLARLTVYTPALPMSRGESFLENRVFANPESVGWESLDIAMRREFVKHCDRGVFDAQTLSAIALDDRYRFVIGRARFIAAAPRGVRLDYDSAAGALSDTYEYAINCTGFDLIARLRELFPPDVRDRVERRAGRVWSEGGQTELAMGRALELKGMQPRLHIPALAALSQGPGFANLGCLGLLANRVLEPLVAERGAGAVSDRVLQVG